MQDGLELTDSLDVRERTYFAIGHLQGAAYFALQAEAIEAAHTPSDWPEIYHVHQAYISGAVLAAISFLEATVNEMFADAYDGITREHLDGLSDEDIARMAESWSNDVPRTSKYSVLEKFDHLLLVTGHTEIDVSKPPGQDISSLAVLRNALVHYEPVTQPTANTPAIHRTPHKFEGRFPRGKFPRNPLVSPGEAYWPSGCLGAGCARWAVSSSVELVRMVVTEIGAKLIIRPLLSELWSPRNSV